MSLSQVQNMVICQSYYVAENQPKYTINTFLYILCDLIVARVFKTTREKREERCIHSFYSCKLIL